MGVPGGILTAQSIDKVIPGKPHNLFEMFDVIAAHSDPKHAATTVDSFVRYYHGARSIALNKAEQLVKVYEKELSELRAKTNANTVVTYSDELVEKEVSLDDKGFRVFMELLRRFVTNYLVIAPYTKLASGVAFHPESAYLVISSPVLQFLLKRYREELASGLFFLFNEVLPQGEISPHNKRVHKLQDEPFNSKVTHIDRDNTFEGSKIGRNYLYDIETQEVDIGVVGTCPFFSVGFMDPNQETEEKNT